MTTTRTAKNLTADVRPSVANILRIYRQATDAQIAEGISWYADAHSLALALSPDDVKRGAGVIAALSPRQDWAGNQRLAIRAFADGHASGTLGDQIRKADRIIAGESPDDVLGGDKVRSFYGVIADPTDAHAVVVDRHAFDVAVGRVTDDGTRRWLSKSWAYGIYADAYRRAAKRVGISPSQLQAVVWVVWRETAAKYHAANAA
jgi:hypothetical protein